MIARLGEVIYILGWLIAAGIMVLGVVMWREAGSNSPELLGWAATAAAVPVGIGFAIRYVLTGQK